ncbi:MAG: hypothetical protein LLF96_11035 [Eubacteriales bacterium]|nr:hypothetical protein [Eubacteriales bacterium]
MDGQKPYDQYEPNEPNESAPGTERHGRRVAAYAHPPADVLPEDGSDEASPNWTADTWSRPVLPGRAYAQRTWDEEEYPANEPVGEVIVNRTSTDNTGAESPTPRPANTENPYIRPTWDESAYASRPASDTSGEKNDRASALYFDADADTSPHTIHATGRPAEEGGADASANPYARPSAPTPTPQEREEQSQRFAPPLRFVMPEESYVQPIPLEHTSAQPTPNVYKQRNPYATQDTQSEPEPRHHGEHPYRVEAESSGSAAHKRPRHTLRRWLIALMILALLAGAAYMERDWLIEKIAPLFGTETAENAQQASGSQQQAAAYDPAPVLQPGERAKKGIASVAGHIDLQSYAVTNRNVVARVALGGGLYDYYLFASADGSLLGYYDALPEDGFLPCPNDIFYVAMPPYLIDNEGQPLIDTARYAQSVGDDPVLGPMINGWALICDQEHTTYNYINANGAVLSTLWFSKAFPFTADSTVAYVDTGNVTTPAERYALYELTRDGTATMWWHTADMNAVLGCACGVVQMDDGRMILLDGQQTVLCTTDDVAVYVDCGAIVARDPATGKYGLFVNGDPHYDFAYDSIAPVQTSDIRWREEKDGFYRQYTVTGVAYPLPLSHYFELVRDDAQEMVALSTSSIYPLLLSTQE